MRPGRPRRALALSGRLLAVAVIIAGASGRLPHLVVTQAVLSSLLTMVAAPFALLDRDRGGSPPRWSIPAFPAVALMCVGTVFLQAPPVVVVIGEGGLISGVALTALLLMAMGFWSVVLPPARLRGLAGAGYVIAGSLPISMPAMFLLTLPRDIYGAFHAVGTSPLAGMEDQIYAGFVLFASVKITLFVAFTFLFLSASSEKVEDGPDGGDGDRDNGRPPTLPGWVKALLRGEPTVEEPAARIEEPAAPVPTGAGSR